MRYPRENDYDALFWAAAQQQATRTQVVGVDAPTLFALAKAHAAVESRFTPSAYNYDGPDLVANVSRGIMQVEGATAMQWGVPTGADTDTYTGPSAPHDYGVITVPSRKSGLYDPAIGIPTGIRIIANNLVATGGDVEKSIAAYNEGLGHALRDSAPYDNQDYVTKVEAAFSYFQAQGVPSSTSDQAATPPDGSSGVGPAAVGVGILLAAAVAYFLARR